MAVGVCDGSHCSWGLFIICYMAQYFLAVMNLCLERFVGLTANDIQTLSRVCEGVDPVRNNKTVTSLSRCLPVWLTLQHLGHDGLSTRIEHTMWLVKLYFSRYFIAFIYKLYCIVHSLISAYSLLYFMIIILLR